MNFANIRARAAIVDRAVPAFGRPRLAEIACDIAPTLANYLRIKPPSAAIAVPLIEMPGD